jgi:hypothetical protein
VAKDQADVPATCVRLEGAARAAATSPESGAAIQKVLTGSGQAAAKEGFSAAMKITIWVVVGMLALTFFVAYLMPRQAREGEDGGH